jgi:hypothetical protein
MQAAMSPIEAAVVDSQSTKLRIPSRAVVEISSPELAPDDACVFQVRGSPMARK